MGAMGILKSSADVSSNKKIAKRESKTKEQNNASKWGSWPRNRPFSISQPIRKRCNSETDVVHATAETQPTECSQIACLSALGSADSVTEGLATALSTRLNKLDVDYDLWSPWSSLRSGFPSSSSCSLSSMSSIFSSASLPPTHTLSAPSITLLPASPHPPTPPRNTRRTHLNAMGFDRDSSSSAFSSSSEEEDLEAETEEYSSCSEDDYDEIHFMPGRERNHTDRERGGARLRNVDETGDNDSEDDRESRQERRLRKYGHQENQINKQSVKQPLPSSAARPKFENTPKGMKMETIELGTMWPGLPMMTEVWVDAEGRRKRIEVFMQHFY